MMPLTKLEGTAECLAVQYEFPSYLACYHGWNKMTVERHTTGTPQAFLAEYTKWPLFQTGGGGSSPDLGEFTEAREAVLRLSAEYASFEAAHTPPQVHRPLAASPYAGPSPNSHASGRCSCACRRPWAGTQQEAPHAAPRRLEHVCAQLRVQSV